MRYCCGMNRPTRSSIARILRHAQAVGNLPEDTTPVGMAAYTRGFVAGRESEWVRRARESRLPGKDYTAA